MPAKKKQATPEVETRPFSEIYEDRVRDRQNLTFRERMDAVVKMNAEAHAKIEAQAPQREKRRARNQRILARHNGRRSSEYYRDVAEADREARV